MTKPYCYEYPRPAVTVDLVAFALADGALRVLMIRRKNDPFVGQLALPGGFLDVDETVESAARRELHEETGLADVGQLAFVGYFDQPDRDPRGRTISFAFAAAIRGQAPEVKGADDASEAEWCDPFIIEKLGFDHGVILAKALDWLMAMIPFGAGAMRLLPEPFDATDLARVCAAVHLVEDRENDLLERLISSQMIQEVYGEKGRFRLTP